jgi:hypothetical protein
MTGRAVQSVRKNRSNTLLQKLPVMLRSQRLDLAYQAGRLVRETLFEGTLTSSISRSEVRRLCRDLAPRASTSPDTIYRAVRVYEVCARLPEIVENGALSVSHVVAVLPIEPERQLSYLKAACENRWSVRFLRRTIEEGATVQSATGRPRVPPVLRTLRQVLGAERSFEGLDALLTVDSDTAKGLLEICRKARGQIDLAEERLERAATGRSCARVLFVDGDRAFTRRARRQLEHLTKMIRVEHSCEGALDRPARDTVCAIIELDLPDGNGIGLAQKLTHFVPELQVIFLASQPTSMEEQRNLGVVVHKASGLESLKVELARAIGSKAPLTTQTDRDSYAPSKQKVAL